MLQLGALAVRWLLRCGVVGLLFVLPAQDAAAAAPRRDVLVVHSYSQEYPWTKRQHEGILSSLAKDISHTYSVRAEYLDTKRVHFDAAYARLIAAQLAAKYAGYVPDAIYVTDDDALKFALEHGAKLFPSAPVVFSGVNDFEVKSRLDRKRYTGVVERKQLGPNLELVRQLFPDVHDIVFVGDASETYSATERELQLELTRFPDIHARFVADRRIDAVLEGLGRAAERVVMLTTLGGLTDGTGTKLTLDESTNGVTNGVRSCILP
jgi:hypothetical protein